MSLAAWAEKKDEAKSDPEGVPVEAKLVVKKDSYKLDLGGKSADEFRKLLKDAEQTGRYPNAPEVDLVLELRNTGDKDLKLWTKGDPVKIDLVLKGDGAVNMPLKGRAFTLEFRLPEAETLAAGKTISFPIKSLAHGFRGTSSHSYWIEPGEYTLTASFITAVSPAPKGSKDAGEGFGNVVLTSAPVKIKVEKK